MCLSVLEINIINFLKNVRDPNPSLRSFLFSENKRENKQSVFVIIAKYYYRNISLL